VIKEDEFFDAIDASLDKLEKEEEDVSIMYAYVAVMEKPLLNRNPL